MKKICLLMMWTVIFFEGASVLGAPFNYEDFKSIVTSKKITSIDALVAELPVEMRSNTLLGYESRGLNAKLISYDSPRMIFYNEDASFILSIHKNPGDEAVKNGEDKSEILVFDNKLKKFNTVTLTFDGQKIPFVDQPPVINDAICLSCHGQNPRPIFYEYSGWPGFYGSYATPGVAVSGTAEYKGLKNFLENAKDQPRYSQLNLSGIYQHEHGLGYRTQYAGYETYKISTNMAFGIEVERRMLDRMAAKLAKRADYALIFPLLYFLGEQSNRCGPPFDRIKTVFEKLDSVSEAGLSKKLIKRIAKQVMIDFDEKDRRINETNYSSRLIDFRGVTAIPFTEMILGVSPYSKTDKDGFEKQMVIIETLFSGLDFESGDLSTTPGFPTSGIFHLSRLGGLLIDEQYFQNLFRAIELVSPDEKMQFDGMQCDAISVMATNFILGFKVQQISDKGILYLD